MSFEKNRMTKLLVALGLVAVIGWLGLQGATRFAAAQSNPFGMGSADSGMGYMMGAAASVEDISDEQWQEMATLHARIHGGETEGLVDQMKAMHAAMQSMWSGMASMHGRMAAPQGMGQDRSGADDSGLGNE